MCVKIERVEQDKQKQVLAYKCFTFSKGLWPRVFIFAVIEPYREGQWHASLEGPGFMACATKKGAEAWIDGNKDGTAVRRVILLGIDGYGTDINGNPCIVAKRMKVLPLTESEDAKKSKNSTPVG